MENYVEYMGKLGALRSKTYEILNKHSSLNPDLKFLYNHNAEFCIHDEKGLVAVLNFGGCGTLPLIKTSRKDQSLNQELLEAGFYCAD